jgi:hypothetical protein
LKFDKKTKEEKEEKKRKQKWKTRRRIGKELHILC